MGPRSTADERLGAPVAMSGSTTAMAIGGPKAAETQAEMGYLIVHIAEWCSTRYGFAFDRGTLMKYPLALLTLLAVGCLVFGGVTGCQKQDQQASETGKAKGKAESDSKACEKLARKICDKTGAETLPCEASKSSFELLSSEACAVGLRDFKVTLAKLEKQGKRCDELIAKLCEGVGPKTEACEMVKAKTKEFPPAQCAEMLGHVDEIVAELRQQEKANQPLDAAEQAKLAAGKGPGFGPQDAKVTIVEFSDFQCPYCSRAASVTSQIKDKYGSKVRFVFRQFPLSFHENAELAAKASLAAHAQGKFWEFHDKMFENQDDLERASLEGYAKELGLNLAKFRAAIDSKENATVVKEDVALGTEMAVQGTPTLFVNGKRITDPTDFEAISTVIEEALKG